MKWGLADDIFVISSLSEFCKNNTTTGSYQWLAPKCYMLHAPEYIATNKHKIHNIQNN